MLYKLGGSQNNTFKNKINKQNKIPFYSQRFKVTRLCYGITVVINIIYQQLQYIRIIKYGMFLMII